MCVKLDSHKVNKKNQTTLLSLLLTIPPVRLPYARTPIQHYTEFIVGLAVRVKQLPVANWQLLCFVNRLRHFCLPYALRDDLLDKAQTSKLSWLEDVAMWPRQIVCILGILFICRTRHKLRPHHYRTRLHLSWRQTLMSWLCFCSPPNL